MQLYRENYINALHTELLEMVEKHLTPVAVRYGYSEAPLEATIKWRPLVLVLGNYSSGKSALINEFLGSDIQKTGQAPTDDSFTILTYDDNADPGSPIHVTEERDGNFLLNDPAFPFESMKKHGQRFTAHFRLKKVNSPFLKELAIIDTPGMLDSVTERDRGYNYQDVIGDFAQIADLILVLFDPHKAGTIREVHTSLRETLPARTFEDRVLFVLNRIDECASLNDLLRVYGTLCWNLSQITGRKDIPMIHLTYSQRAGIASRNRREHDLSYLQYLENQREELKKAVMEAPRHRLDHLAAFVETHSERLGQMLQALVNYRRKRSSYRMKNLFTGAMLSLTCAGAAIGALLVSGILGGLDLVGLMAGRRHSVHGFLSDLDSGNLENGGASLPPKSTGTARDVDPLNDADASGQLAGGSGQGCRFSGKERWTLFIGNRKKRLRSHAGRFSKRLPGNPRSPQRACSPAPGRTVDGATGPFSCLSGA